MGPLALLFGALLHLFVIGLDVVAFFAIVRIVFTRWPVSPLQAIDRVGTPVIDPLIDAVVQAFPGLRGMRSQRQAMMAAAIVLFVIGLSRLGLAAFAAN